MQGRGKSALCVHTLWLGTDHLLYVEDFGIKQRYRRFAYSDLQLLRIRATPGRGLRLSMLVALAIAAALLGTIARVQQARLGFVVAALLMLAALARELWLGPSCTTVLYTQVSKIPLPSLNRLRNAERAVEQLARALAPFQQELPAEALRSLPLSPALHFERRTVPPDFAGAHSRGRRGFWSFALCVAAWLSALSSLSLVAFGGRALAIALAVITLSLFVVAIAAAANVPAGRIRAAAVAGLSAGVIAMSGLWLMEASGTLQFVPRSGLEVRTGDRPGSLAELAREPAQRGVLAWLTLSTILIAAGAASVQSTRGLLARGS